MADVDPALMQMPSFRSFASLAPRWVLKFGPRRAHKRQPLALGPQLLAPETGVGDTRELRDVPMPGGEVISI